MRNTALFFPYIQPPNNAWFRQMVLYWDEVGAIVPRYYPNDYGFLPHVRELLKTGLLRSVYPLEFISDISDFGATFLTHIEARLAEEQLCPRWSKLKSGRTLIHVEKLGRIGEELCRMHLAEQVDYSWYNVDSWVAGDFMAYLTCVLGRAQGNDFVPITNDGYCQAVISGRMPSSPIIGSGEVISVRDTVLDFVLPSPPPMVSFRALADFKERNRSLLKSFRDLIERKTILLESITDKTDRAFAARGEAEELREKVIELDRRIRERWRKVTFYSLLPIVSATASFVGAIGSDAAGWVASITGLSATTYVAADALRKADNEAKRPLAYASKLRRKNWLKVDYAS